MIPINLLPPGTNYFIAGGFAVCPALASDRDVFVQTTGDVLETRQLLIDHLTLEGYDFTEEEECRSFATNDYSEMVEIAKVARVRVRGSSDIQLLLTCADVEDVLSTFDISTCQIAITGNGKIVKGPCYTPPIDPPIKLKDTPTTDARMRKYEARFGR